MLGGEWQVRNRELLLWASVFTIAGIFQVYRGAPLDGSFFLFAVVVMSFLHVKDFQAFPIARGYLIRLYFLGVAIFLACSKIHTKPSLMAVIMFLPFIPYAMRGRGVAKQVTLPLARSIGIWTAFAVTVAFYEMLSYIVGDITDRSFHYPTISMLVDPMLHNQFGRATFVVCWCWVGNRFIFPRKVL